MSELCLISEDSLISGDGQTNYGSGLLRKCNDQAMRTISLPPGSPRTLKISFLNGYAILTDEERMKFCDKRYCGVLGRKLRRLGLQNIVFIQVVILLFILYHMASFNSVEEEETLFRYQPPAQSRVTTTGRRLEVNKIFWRRKSLRYLTLTKELAQDFVIVTAASTVYYRNSLEAIATVQKFLPDHHLFFYDLERKNDKVNERIAQKFNALCGVTYRLFDFSLYPEHVRRLKTYSWKPIIVYEMLKEFPGVLWIDSSIRFTTNNFTRIFQKAAKSDGMLALTSTGHSNFAVTHPQMYDFLPTSKEGMIKTDQHEANCVLVYRTRPAMEQVVWWWMLCALDPLCIAPTDRTSCQHPYAARNVQADCHRFDQSALNILLANYFAFDSTQYFGSAEVAQVNRFSDGSGHVEVCLPGVPRTAQRLQLYLQSGKSSVGPSLTSTMQDSRRRASELPLKEPSAVIRRHSSLAPTPSMNL